MAEMPKNQPTFNINQAGTINTGDVTIQQDQVGIQHNYAFQQNLTEKEMAEVNLDEFWS